LLNRGVATDARSSMHRIFGILALALACAITASACAPIPCPSGYADPDWCRHFRGAGGDGH
jgi:hypothetical protein